VSLTWHCGITEVQGVTLSLPMHTTLSNPKKFSTLHHFMEINKCPITIVTVCNNNFPVLLAALIKSLELTHVRKEDIHLYIVNDGIDRSNRQKIEHSTGGKIEIKWIEIADVYPKNISLPLDSSTFPLNVYVRLFIPDFLPSFTKKAIYMDVDMIVKKDISFLWNIDLGDYYIAGVPDLSERLSSEWAGITNFRELGLNGDAKYYNSGLLLMNLAKWRVTDLSVQILNCINENRQFANFPDQYGLNVIFADQWLELDKRWNTYAPSNEAEPFIIHFIGRKPIYSTYENNPHYKQEFLFYLKFTEFADFVELKEYNRLFHKLYYRLNKKLIGLIRKIRQPAPSRSRN
jgi:lipopolysaccharide biosynthesis glycosyltransferase